MEKIINNIKSQMTKKFLKVNTEKETKKTKKQEET